MTGDHYGPRAAVEFFSETTRSLEPGTEFGGSHAVVLLERRREMAVARKAEVRGQPGQVVALRELVERAREAQPQVVAIQRQAFHLLEHLREIHRRTADFRRDLR